VEELESQILSMNQELERENTTENPEPEDKPTTLHLRSKDTERVTGEIMKMTETTTTIKKKLLNNLPKKRKKNQESNSMTTSVKLDSPSTPELMSKPSTLIPFKSERNSRLRPRLDMTLESERETMMLLPLL